MSINDVRDKEGIFTFEEICKYPPEIDWKDDEDYLHLNNATYYDFAWEFLRRNKTYQADVCEWLQAVSTTAPHLLEGTSQQLREKSVFLDNYFPSNYHIAFPIPPSLKCPLHIFTPYNLSTYVKGPNEPGSLTNTQLKELALGPNEFVFKFDVSLPKEKQLEAAERTFQLIKEQNTHRGPESNGKTESKPRPGSGLNDKEALVKMLRLLDAEQSGATIEEMRDKIHPDTKGKMHHLYKPTGDRTKSTTRDLERARKTRDNNYKILIGLGAEEINSNHSTKEEIKELQLLSTPAPVSQYPQAKDTSTDK